MINENFDLSDIYIERCDKETEEMIAVESASFLEQPLHYLQTHKNEFVYLESKSFEEIGVDAVCLEMDDVFGTYDVMLGLKLQKKFGTALKEFLNRELKGNGAKFDLIFNEKDGMWDFNFGLDFINGFHNELSLSEAFQIIYQFLIKLRDEMGVS